MQSRIDGRHGAHGFQRWRALVMALVAVGHIVVLRAVLQGVVASPPQPTDVMLIRLDLPAARALPLRPAVTATPSAQTRRRRRAPERTRREAPVALSADHWLTAPPSPADKPTNAVHGYVAGGGALSDMPFAAKAIRVPGAWRSASELRLPMADGREQGLTGIVKLIHDTAGGIDRHCLDFDVWRGLTPAELAARHVTTEAMEKAADEHGCRLLSPSMARGTDGAFGAKPIPRGEP